MQAADGGDGILSAWATNVCTLADVAHDVPAPPQGLPEFGDKFSMLPFPERPLPLVTSFLARLPPQALPGPCPPPVPWT
eukprot:4773134-Pleurochrysis_carterae.AAC.1